MAQEMLPKHGKRQIMWRLVENGPKQLLGKHLVDAIRWHRHKPLQARPSLPLNVPRRFSSVVVGFAQINAGKIPGFLSGDREVLDELLGHSDITPAMSSTIRVLNLLTSSAGFDSGKVLYVVACFMSSSTALLNSLRQVLVVRSVCLQYRTHYYRFLHYSLFTVLYYDGELDAVISY